MSFAPSMSQPLDRTRSQTMTPALRHWIWTNFGWDVYDWDDEELRF